MKVLFLSIAIQLLSDKDQGSASIWHTFIRTLHHNKTKKNYEYKKSSYQISAVADCDNRKIICKRVGYGVNVGGHLGNGY